VLMRLVLPLRLVSKVARTHLTHLHILSTVHREHLSAGTRSKYLLLSTSITEMEVVEISAQFLEAQAHLLRPMNTGPMHACHQPDHKYAVTDRTILPRCRGATALNDPHSPLKALADSVRIRIPYGSSPERTFVVEMTLSHSQKIGRLIT
jgi:hypothetical protein